MLIKVMPHAAKARHRPCDVARHARYLLAGKGLSADGPDFAVRLAGPPYAQKVIQRVIPTDDYRLAAKDVAQQMVSEVLAGYIGEARPHRLYAHIVFSFAPRYRARNALAPTAVLCESSLEDRFEGTFHGALRIALDALARLSADTRYPVYLVIHADKRHLHAHALVGLRAKGVPVCEITNLNSSTIRSIARQIDRKYGISKPSSAIRHAHQHVVRSAHNWSLVATETSRPSPHEGEAPHAYGTRTGRTVRTSYADERTTIWH
jgi:hypothetical protein